MNFRLSLHKRVAANPKVDTKKRETEQENSIYVPRKIREAQKKKESQKTLPF